MPSRIRSVATTDTKEPVIDPERDEALNILGDLVDLSRGPKTASVRISLSGWFRQSRCDLPVSWPGRFQPKSSAAG